MSAAPSVGLATKSGLSAALIQFVTAVLLLIDGDHSTAAVAALVSAGVTLITVLVGRYVQAVKLTPSADGK